MMPLRGMGDARSCGHRPYMSACFPVTRRIREAGIRDWSGLVAGWLDVHCVGWCHRTLPLCPTTSFTE